MIFSFVFLAILSANKLLRKAAAGHIFAKSRQASSLSADIIIVAAAPSGKNDDFGGVKFVC